MPSAPLKITKFVCLVFARMVFFGAVLASSHSLAQNSNRSDNEDLVDFETKPIGSISLVIGRAFVSSEGKGPERLRTGDLLVEGDQIRTESSGHVHVRFLDDAVLSVRPNSELHIETYRFDAERPDLSTVKLNLIQGTARTVSGEAAKTAKERYRLNTPIAAIGVRGTDFLVSTTSQSLMALVNDGAIVVAPFSAQCQFEGTGPCSLNAVELDGEAMQAIEFDLGMTAPRLTPLLTREPNLEQSQSLAGGLAARAQSILTEDAPQAARSGQGDEASTKEVVAESLTSLKLGDNAKTQAPYSTGFTPEERSQASELKGRQLVWGRFAEGKGNLERLTLPLSEAAQGRKVTVGGNFEYFLFRPEQNEAEVSRGLGEIGFSLTSAQAYFKEGDLVTPVAVSGGELLMDFNKNAFQTSLDLYHMQLGSANFEADGRIYGGGYFHSRNDESRIVGAVSLDGLESGYFFDFFSWDGLVQGITIWDAGK